MKLLHLTITLSFFAVLLLPLATRATGACGVDNAIHLSVYIPGITGVVPGESGAAPCYYLKKAPGSTSSEKAGSLPDYIAGIYYLGVRLGGLIALLMLMIGGAEWVFAQGSPEKISKSKERMVNALVGLMLLLVSYTILNLINPQLVNLKPLNLEPVKAIVETPTPEKEAAAKIEITNNNREQAQQAYDRNPTEENKRLLAEATAANDAARNKQEQIAQQKKNIAATALANSLRVKTEGQTTDILLNNAITELKKIADMDVNNAVGRQQALHDFVNNKSGAGALLNQRFNDEGARVGGRIQEIIESTKKDNNLNIRDADYVTKIKIILDNNPEYLQLSQEKKQLAAQQTLYNETIRDITYVKGRF